MMGVRLKICFPFQRKYGEGHFFLCSLFPLICKVHSAPTIQHHLKPINVGICHHYYSIFGLKFRWQSIGAAAPEFCHGAAQRGVRVRATRRVHPHSVPSRTCTAQPDSISCLGAADSCCCIASSSRRKLAGGGRRRRACGQLWGPARDGGGAWRDHGQMPRRSCSGPNCFGSPYLTPVNKHSFLALQSLTINLFKIRFGNIRILLGGELRSLLEENSVILKLCWTEGICLNLFKIRFGNIRILLGGNWEVFLMKIQ